MKRLQTICISLSLLGGALAVGQASGWESSNGLAPNGMALNGMALNGLAAQALRDLSDAPSLHAWMVDKNDREVLRVLVECALPPGDELTLSSPTGVSTLAGGLGLAPEWKTAPMTESGQKWVSACLLAHVNAKGAHVLISLRGDHKGLEPTADEIQDYRAEEGAFYGNLFDDRPYAVSCIGDSGQSSPDASDRVCATDVHGTTTACGFVSVGECRSSCGVERHAYGPTFTDCQLPGMDGNVAKEVITVFLNTEGAEHP